MESFDFLALLKKHEKKHKRKPMQFVSVAAGVQRRLQNNIRERKSNRLSIFDSIRKLEKCDSPVVQLTKAQLKVEKRRQQLEKWKEEKEKRKKEAAALKKKPFLTGVPHAPSKLVSPPPKPMPSTSGRVTRSQSAKNRASQKIDSGKCASQSFAPKNAVFKPPQNLVKLPNLTQNKPKVTKNTNSIFVFDPVIPKNLMTKVNDNVKVSKLKKQVETNLICSKNTEAKMTKGKATKPIQRQNSPKKIIHTSSSSEVEENIHSPILNSSRKSLPAQNSPQLYQKTPRKSIGVVQNFTPKNNIPKSESRSEEKLRSPKSPTSDVLMTPEQIADEAKKISPCVTMSRGKANARKEMKKKLEEGLLDEDTCDIENVDHFRKQLASEVKRMTELCDTWEKISEQTPLPDAIQEGVLSAVGQARLLMSQKLMQFSTLVERCGRPEPGAALVTPADLHGFWDMVFMQVENVDMRFKKLEELRLRGWIDDKPVEVKKKITKNNVKKTSKPMGGTSRLRDMIAAARKAKKEQECYEAPKPPELGVSKTFEAGFFCVQSPVRSPRVSTPSTSCTLLKAVLSSEAKKASVSAAKNAASFAMLRAAGLAKNIECDGVAPLPQTPLNPVNVSATPARSILKSAQAERSSKKSIKVVLFDRSDLEPDCPSDTDRPDLHQENENKENSRRKSKLIRQDATEERSPVMTRSRRKSLQGGRGSADAAMNSSKKKALREVEQNTSARETPARSSRRRKSGVTVAA